MLGRSMLYREHGPHREIVLANAAAALVAAGTRARISSMACALAAQSIDSGAARERLEALVAFSQAFEDRTSHRFLTACGGSLPHCRAWSTPLSGIGGWTI